MRKFLSLMIALVLGGMLYTSQASNADYFSVDMEEINAEFSQLNELEAFVLENPSATVRDIVNNGSSDFANMNMASMSVYAMDDFEFMWEGFLWGFLCCPVGFFVVAINGDKSSDNKLSYWIGVAAGAVLGAITTPIYYY